MSRYADETHRKLHRRYRSLMRDLANHNCTKREELDELFNKYKLATEALNDYEDKIGWE